MDHVLRTFKRYYLFAGIRMNVPPFIGVAVVCFLIAWNNKANNPTPATVLVTFFYLFMKLANTLGELYGSLNSIPLSVDSTRKIQAVANEMTALHGQFEVRDDRSNKPISLESVELKLTNATFSYLKNSDQPPVGPIQLEARRGQCITLKGPSGAGKSTVLGMLMGVYEPQTGQATLNGVDLSQIRKEFSKFISYVGPEPYLIPGTLKENLTYCSEDLEITEPQIWDVLEKVGLSEFFHARKLGLEERLSDLAELSTGQRQRISIARALLRQTPILVLDEATANLDSVTERLILNHLQALKPNTLLLISTHKSTFDDISDQIIEMKGTS